MTAAGRLLNSLSHGPQLVVRLPENSAELARAAAEGGADALKVHLHVKHEASGTEFGSLEDERANLEAILSLGLPTGIVPGAAGCLPSRQEMGELAAMGLDFFDVYARHMPIWLAFFEGMTRAVAIDHEMNLDMLPELQALGFEMIEAAVVPHEGYGEPLSVADLAAYRAIRHATALPVIVPTQRAIEPEDVPALVGEAGVNAVMIGAIVAGRSPGSLRAATERFAAALSAFRN